MSFRAKENLSKTAHFAFARNPALVLGFHSNRRGHGKLQTDSSLRRPGTPLAAATGHDSSLSNLYPNCQSQQKDANSCCNQNIIHIYLTQKHRSLGKYLDIISLPMDAVSPLHDRQSLSVAVIVGMNRKLNVLFSNSCKN